MSSSHFISSPYRLSLNATQKNIFQRHKLLISCQVFTSYKYLSWNVRNYYEHCRIIVLIKNYAHTKIHENAKVCSFIRRQRKPAIVARCQVFACALMMIHVIAGFVLFFFSLSRAHCRNMFKTDFVPERPKSKTKNAMQKGILLAPNGEWMARRKKVNNRERKVIWKVCVSCYFYCITFASLE